ncbi:hypothetical protein [Methylomonas koyamae]|uniref:hypothetical protein n=1 Tax=Methylomonas koyamae TaxID=702114 RepID=UPI00210F8D95|nr:hypothetical protein [Methylomonas koyamae]
MNNVAVGGIRPGSSGDGCDRAGLGLFRRFRPTEAAGGKLRRQTGFSVLSGFLLGKPGKT